MKDNSKTNYTNVTLNLIQSLFKFNKLDNGKTCLGLRHWRLLSNLKNNFSRPVRNDMINKNRKELIPLFPYFLVPFKYVFRPDLATNQPICQHRQTLFLKQVERLKHCHNQQIGE